MQTVKNKLSGAKTWVEEMGGDISPFSARVVTLTIRGGVKASSHVPRRAPAITPDMLKYIIDYTQEAGRHGAAPRAALLIGYFTFLRQSNLLSPSTNTWGGPHTIRRSDIRVVPGGLRVDIRSSKTIQLTAEAVSLFVPKVSGSRYCPVAAWHRYCELVPGQPDDPAFVTRSGPPLTPGTLIKLVRAALTRMGITSPHRYTLHGLRRGAAQKCAALNVKTEHIMAQGTWKSSVVKTYTIPQAPINAPAALASVFG